MARMRVLHFRLAFERCILDDLIILIIGTFRLLLLVIAQFFFAGHVEA